MTDPDWLADLRRIQEHMRSGGAPFGLTAAVAHHTESARLQRIRELAEHGATEGERDAARAALHRIEMAGDEEAEEAGRMFQELQDEEDAAEAEMYGAL